MKKILSLALSLVIICSLSVPAFAAEYQTGVPMMTNALRQPPNLTQRQKAEMNHWVSYDEASKQFFVKDGARDALGEEDYALLHTGITSMNFNLTRVDFSRGEVTVTTPEQEKTIKISFKQFGDIQKA